MVKSVMVKVSDIDIAELASWSKRRMYSIRTRKSEATVFDRLAARILDKLASSDKEVIFVNISDDELIDVRNKKDQIPPCLVRVLRNLI